MLQLTTGQSKDVVYFDPFVIENIQKSRNSLLDAAIDVKQKAFIEYVNSGKMDPNSIKSGFSLININAPIDNEELAWEGGAFPQILDTYTSYQNIVYYFLVSSGMISSDEGQNMSAIRDEILKHLDKHFKALVTITSIYGKKKEDGEIDVDAGFEIKNNDKSFSLKTICEIFGHINENDIMTVNAAIQNGFLTPDKKLDRIKKNTTIYENIIGYKVDDIYRDDLLFAVCNLSVNGMGNLASMSGNLLLYIGAEPDVNSQTRLILDKAFRS